MHYQMERTYGCRISDAWTFRGLKTVIMENDQIRVTVLADKGADIYEFVHKSSDTDFMWRTPWGVRDPSKWVPTSGWGNGLWHDVYEGGWQTIAPTGGSPMNYRGAEIGQHNESAIMPWDCQVLEDTPDRVSAKFWVRTYRTPFYIEKTLTIVRGDPTLHIEESVVNEAEEEAECVWGQHIALGSPFLSPSCRLDVPAAKFFVPGNEDEGQGGEHRLKPGQSGTFPKAVDPKGKAVDLHNFPPKSARLADYCVMTGLAEGWYAVTNQERGVGFAFVYPKEVYPYLWFWQVFGGGTGWPWYRRNYNIGLEPFSSLANGKPLPGSNKPTSVLMKAGEKRTISMKAVAYESKKGVSRVTSAGVVTFRR
ncbi:MAG: DUF4432 family protein [Dehalococcoidia bacterium]|nr:DUF4432 family protein [Dehalococcoidia bacterium]